MEFRKYQHIERMFTDEVQDIELGNCYVFPKIDGTNSSVWLDDNGILCAGSRNRKLSLENDNGGFLAYISQNQNIINYLRANPIHRLFGEWLIPHSLRTYQSTAWNKFYIFDVCIDKDDETLEYIPYDIYKPMLEQFNLDYIPCICKITAGKQESFYDLLEKNLFLIENGKGYGEGIVIKNYDYYNKYGRQTWGKIVTNEFKEKHIKEMGYALKTDEHIEEKIAQKYVTKSLVDKEFDKIRVECNGWKSSFIPRLFSTVYHTLIVEEIWNIVKEFKYPIINFKLLNAFVISNIKGHKKELF